MPLPGVFSMVNPRPPTGRRRWIRRVHNKEETAMILATTIVEDVDRYHSSRGRNTHYLRRRRNRLFAVAASTAALWLSMVATPAVAVGMGAPVGAVYVASNAYSANSILTFLRFTDGSLVPASQVPTGGRGS